MKLKIVLALLAGAMLASGAAYAQKMTADDLRVRLRMHFSGRSA